MADRFHHPISRAFRPEDTAETLATYRHSQQHGKDAYAAMVGTFYDLITDFYEYGWGQSFHFAPAKIGESLADALLCHQLFLGEAIGLRPGMKVLDVGCGIGGPQRALATKFGASIVGLNINEYQVQKCSTYNSEANLEHLCSVLHGDFMDIPVEDRSFDAAYHIEALAHAPDKTAAYAEILRVLRPGAVFAGYDWCTRLSTMAQVRSIGTSCSESSTATRFRKLPHSRMSPTGCGRPVSNSSRRAIAPRTLTRGHHGIDLWREPV